MKAFFEEFKRPFKWFSIIGYISLFIVLLGFVLLSFPKLDAFFGDYPWLYYSVFLGPICIFILVYCIFFIIITIISLFREYKRLRNEGKPVPNALLQVAKIAGLLLLALAALLLEFYWP
jgi:hypothetical protein